MHSFFRPISVLIVVSLSYTTYLSAVAHAQETPESTKNQEIDDSLWLNRHSDIDTRAHALLHEMTIVEKIGQLWQVNGIGGEPTGDSDNLVAGSELYDLIQQGHVGSILNEVNPDTINAMQRVGVEESRLGIPLVIGRDVIHGFRTIFPIPLGQAASWNPALVEAAAAVAAKEARSQGVHWTFAPMIDIARDPRWGRIAESLGEDPYLVSAMSAAMVLGFQGNDLSKTDRIAACAKHFAGYGAVEGGRDYNTVVLSQELLHNVYLPPFRAAVNAGVATLMTSFNEVNGIPSSANRYLFRDVLREQWGFRGFVVSDWDSVEEMIEHGYSADRKAAALTASTAGVNMEMVSPSYHDHLATLIAEGAIAESVVNELAGEVLRIKFRLGLFDNPYVDTSQPSPLLAEEHLQLARELARQSVVLLKNEKEVLPLDKASLKTLAVIGPLADAKRDQLGTWILDGKESDSRTLLEAIRRSAGSEVEVLYVPALESDLDRKTGGFEAAIKAAQEADAVLLVLGEQANISGEARSRAILDLPGAQNQLVDAIAAIGKPVVMIIQAGRPLTIGAQIDQVDVVLYSLHAGTMTGPAIADLVWGVESPSGKLPVTFPKTVGQVPLYYNHKNTGRPPRLFNSAKDWKVDDEIDTGLGNNSNYIDVEPYPLFPFGYGLSYTTFEYGKAELSTTKLRAGQTLAIRVPVTNSGSVAADELVQLYVRDRFASVTRPVRELKGFRRETIEPGETLVVDFALASDDLAFFNNDAVQVLEPGVFEIYVGGSSLAPLVGQVEVVE